MNKTPKKTPSIDELMAACGDINTKIARSKPTYYQPPKELTPKQRKEMMELMKELYS